MGTRSREDGGNDGESVACRCGRGAGVVGGWTEKVRESKSGG